MGILIEPNIMNLINTTEGKSSFSNDNYTEFKSYSPKELNAQIWGVFPTAQRPYFYGRVQSGGEGIMFEPASNFNANDIDLPFTL